MPRLSPAQRRTLAVRLGELTRRFHQAGFVHRDLYLCHVFVPTTPIRAAALVTSLVFYVYTIVLVLHYALRTDDVTADEIFGAVSVYILIGLAWGMGFSFLELLAPGSIYSVKGALVPGDFLYFSFITLMTVKRRAHFPASS